MTSGIRIDAAEAFRKQQRDDAILVCAYDDEDKCRDLRLDGSYTLGELREQQGELSDELEVIFYCT